MSEVKRYAIYSTGKWEAREVKAGAWVRWYDYDAQRLRADTAEARVKTAEHDLEFFKAGKNEQFDRAEAAEQRIAERDELIADVLKAFNLDVEGRGSCTNPGITFIRPWADRVAALNPNPEAESNE